MTKWVLLLLFLIPTSSFATDLNLSYPGSFGAKYDRSLGHEVSDVHEGRLMLTTDQGIALNRNVLYIKLNLYEPFKLTADIDNYLSFGVKHKTKMGLEFGIEEEFVFNNVDRYVVFTEYFKEWDFGR